MAAYLLALSFAGYSYLNPQMAKAAAILFEAKYDNGVLTADYGVGDKTAYDDGSPATIINPGYNSSAGAAQLDIGHTMRYKTLNNVSPQGGEIEMKFKSPGVFTGSDGTTNKLYSPSSVYYDSPTGYLYIAEAWTNRIIKTKLDGTGWVTYGSSGIGAGQFNQPLGLTYDPNTGYIYCRFWE